MEKESLKRYKFFSSHYISGQVAVAGHLHIISDGITVAGKRGVTKSFPTGKYGGTPVVPIHEYNRNQVFLRYIEQYVEQLKALAKKM